MSQGSQVVASGRTRFLVVFLAAVAAALLMLGGHESTARAENNCSSGEMCAWDGTSYTLTERFLPCVASVGGSVYVENGELKSAKNRCSGQSLRLGWYEGGSIKWKVCMSPGGERPEPGRFNWYERVGSC